MSSMGLECQSQQIGEPAIYDLERANQIAVRWATVKLLLWCFMIQEKMYANVLLLELFEFLLTIVGSSRFVKVVANYLQELVYYTFGFMQITDQQMHAWSLDANQYISDEEDNTYNCRVSGMHI
ncbi:Importin-9 [Bienertia sinuspersici]